MTRNGKPKKAAKKAQNPKAESSTTMHKNLLMTYADIRREFNLSRVTIWRLCKRGMMPKPKTLGHRTVRFARTAIERWINDGMPRVARDRN